MSNIYKHQCVYKAYQLDACIKYMQIWLELLPDHVQVINIQYLPDTVEKRTYIGVTEFSLRRQRPHTQIKRHTRYNAIVTYMSPIEVPDPTTIVVCRFEKLYPHYSSHTHFNQKMKQLTDQQDKATREFNEGQASSVDIPFITTLEPS